LNVLAPNVGDLCQYVKNRQGVNQVDQVRIGACPLAFSSLSADGPYQIWNATMRIWKKLLGNQKHCSQKLKRLACSLSSWVQELSLPLLPPNLILQDLGLHADQSDHQCLDYQQKQRIRRLQTLILWLFQQLSDAKITNSDQQKGDNKRKWWKNRKIEEKVRQSFPFSMSKCRFYEENDKRPIDLWLRIPISECVSLTPLPCDSTVEAYSS
jgi:hypothetical protein